MSIARGSEPDGPDAPDGPEAPDEPGVGAQPRARYHSPLREERAADTRRRIAAAAGELFSEHGFSGTTVASIARRAGVSEATIYATYGTKGAIVGALLSEMEEHADVAGWSARIDGESDPRRKLAAFARWTRVLFSSSKATIAAAAGALSDPVLIELRDEGNRRRREGLRELVASLADAGALQRGLSLDEALDRAWMLSGLELYLGAVDGCGWGDDQYERGLSDLLSQQLLEEPGARTP
ncbi:MAG: TetR/AcrR family transcriptional regulator [Solirubrobacteraceae bacterium]